MARKIVEAGTEVSKHLYAKPFVITAFKEVIESASSANAAADTDSDNFDDGFYLLRNAVRVIEAWKDFWSDFHHNGRPARCLLSLTSYKAISGAS